MKQTYLYQLYKYSRPACWLVLLFIISYGLFFFKKMDMMLFPHNSMFAYNPAVTVNHASTYGIRVNDSLVKTTSFLYWKKDFVESALSAYAKYEEAGRQVYLQQYFASNHFMPGEIEKKLLPDEKEATRFLPWLLNFIGYSTGDHTKISLYRYDFTFTNGSAVLQDSLLIFSQKISRR